jgi:hypothetical protein
MHQSGNHQTHNFICDWLQCYFWYLLFMYIKKCIFFNHLIIFEN